VPSRRLIGRAPLIAALLVVAVAACGTSTGLAAPVSSPTPSGPSPAWPAGVETYEVESRLHTEGDVDYETTPPTGGDHSETWQNCGIYDEPIRDENAVHSLEHGSVWLTYGSNVADDDVEHLESLVGTSGSVLLSPYEGMAAPVVATAWGVQLEAQDAHDPRLVRFLQEYVRGSQSPEPDAPCTGGIGEPLTTT
jgi:hypothetical protein